MDAFEVIRRDEHVEELAGLLSRSAGAVAAEGLWGSSAPILAAIVAERLGRPLLLVVAHSDEADDVRDDIETAIGTAPDLLPQLDSLDEDPFGADELAGERLRLCVELVGRAERREAADPDGGEKEDDRPPLVVAPVMALMQPVPAAEAIRARSLTIARGDVVDVDTLLRWLTDHGFQRCDAVEVPGDFACRGGIVDIYSHAHTDPVRVELFGDAVESLRVFDAGTQRSSHELQGLQVPALRAAKDERPDRQTTSFLAHLPPETLIAFNEPGEIQELGRTFLQRLGERAGVIPVDALFRRANDFAQLHLQRFAGAAETAVRFDVSSLPQFEPKTPDALRALSELAAEADVLVLCENRAEEQRFGELLREEASQDRGSALPSSARHGGEDGAGASTFVAHRLQTGATREPTGATAEPSGATNERSGTTEGPLVAADEGSGAAPPEVGRAMPADAEAQDATRRAEPALRKPEAGRAERALLKRVRTELGVVHRGFRWRHVAFVPHHELFHRYRQRRTLRRVAPARPVDSFFDLEAGDHVVHVVHGIGRFLGLKTLNREGRVDEYLALEFADKAVVHVPISQIHVVQKYIGSFRGKPRLSKIGGSAWKRTKERVAEAVTDMAAELLAVQARRAAEAGSAYPQDTEWQREFEDAFIYEETEDQLSTLEQIKRDLTRPRPMDRLLCGDVGYGKTELAMRAAFKVIEYGKQVAVLVPTTVLAEQHFHTFRERMADYPFSVEVLSRFRTDREQARIVAAARKGRIDILIGTHRLLSRDVGFSDLGLVIIDEEQRFGVDAKERLKRLRATVEVLTLTATPIPRTLHMSMLGIRDISSLATPPVDRRAIVTQVRLWDDQLIRQAVLRELNRDGQVYFVHNFVRDIHSVANRLRTIVPEARIVVGHGQMGGTELEQVMLQFIEREADVLVSTNIIESGLDIPTANTIFINRAERFGLADLHQLRGRVGRSQHRAYAYALLSPKHPVQEHAARRLKAFEHYSALGAGFQIAMRDLELRGAGNILGPEQSGHIEAVGYEMYCQLLEQAVRRLKNEPAEVYQPVNLDLGISATIPRTYIRADRQRMEVYKRLTSCRTLAELETLRDDLRDAFGAPPEGVETLLALTEIRVLAAPWGVRSLVLDEPDVIFSVDDLQRVEPLLADGPGSPRVPDAQTIHWRLPRRYLEPKTLVSVLRHQLRQRSPEGAAAAGAVRSTS